VAITARVTLGKDGDAFRLAVHLTGHLPDMPAADAMALLEKAHQVCPYSAATRGNIEVTLAVADDNASRT
jgi:organic hydroperoxide reductase OsmC/OhrA